MAHYSTDDPYTDPGTGVLFNLLGITDQKALDEAEADIVSARLVELAQRPVSGNFDTAHLQAIHRHLFSDIYEWAGSFRTIGISKGNSMFCMPAHLDSFGAAIFRTLHQERRLSGLALPQFVERAAYFLGELNAFHPFREGNGRTQREFIRQLAATNGFEVMWSNVSADRMIEASIASFSNDLNPLIRILSDNTHPQQLIRNAALPAIRARSEKEPDDSEWEM